jgi:hypothetical protein
MYYYYYYYYYDYYDYYYDYYDYDGVMARQFKATQLYNTFIIINIYYIEYFYDLIIQLHIIYNTKRKKTLNDILKS